MKLYYSKGTCSLSPHIVLFESGLPFEAIHASTKTHQLPDGSDYYKINPLGYVPLLVLDNGEQLREGAAIVQYLGDQAPDKHLVPAWGTMARYHLIEWLNFIATELHKGFSPLFNPATPAEFKPLLIERLVNRFAFVDGELANKKYLMGEQFTVADPYLFTVSSWAPMVKTDITHLTHLQAYLERIKARPAVQAALRAEGLLG